MSCFRPFRAYRDEDDRVVLKAGSGRPDSRFGLPCGKCVGCRMARARMWTVRCVHEAKMHAVSSFVTLTYAPEKIPGGGSLQLRDWQLFAKRVRRSYGEFRFFMCGEYGGKTLRPHYHALMFGLDWPRDRLLRRGRGPGGSEQRLYESEELARIWGLGNASHAVVTPSTAAYVARYSVKKQRDVMRERYERVDRKTGEVWKVDPEFQVMSRRPGLGAAWLEKYEQDVFPMDEVVLDGRRMGVPRYYLDRVSPEVLAEVKEKRRAFIEKCSEDETPARLQVREEVAEARLSQLGRGL